jgi:hypothetical protein
MMTLCPLVAISVQFAEGFYHACPEGIKMYIADQFCKIGIFITDDGWVSILKQIPMAFVPIIILRGVAA